MALWKKAVKRTLASMGYRLVKHDGGASAASCGAATPQGPTLLAPWEKDKAFWPIFEGMSQRTLVDLRRCHILYQMAVQTRTLPGDVAEVGVYKGGTAHILGHVFNDAGDKPIHLFDTFAGLPEVDPAKDKHNKGDFADTSLEAVKEFLAPLRNLHFYQGFFPQTAGPVADRKFCFVSSDVDIYPSVKASCEFFYPRLVPGGAIVFDDYGLSSCPGVISGVDEFFADKPERPIHMECGQCVVVKLP